MIETELKFVIHGAFALPELDPVSTGVAEVVTLEPQDLRATYFDTEDLRLARNGITLRHRSGEKETATWTVKLPLPERDAESRDEIHLEDAGSAVPGAAKDLVTAFTRASKLVPVALLRTKRRRWAFRDENGKDLAELDEDEVSILQSRRVVARFRELELEARDTDGIGLAQIANSLRGAGAIDSEPIPKAVRALGPRATAPPDVPLPNEVTSIEPAARAIQSAITRGTRRMMFNDPATRMGDPEGVHQMRVSARRLRSDLKTFGDLVDQNWTQSLVAELKWLADALGAVRDLDVMQARLRKDAEDLEGPLAPMFAAMAAQHEQARTDLLEALRSRRYAELLDRLVVAASLPMVTEAAGRPCDEVLPPLVESRWNKLAAHARAITSDAPDDRLHEVRIRAKRTRYATEAISSCLPKGRRRDAEAFARLVADVQETLGEHQDASVASDAILKAATDRPEDAAFQMAAGRLLERQSLAAASARANFAKTWGKLDRKKNRRWLTA